MVEFRPNFELPEMVGDSPQFHRLRDDIARAAELDLPVLVRGERGTGKELVAWEVFRSSPRAGQIYLRVNIGSLNPSTRIAELFGHEKGAFTGADSPKPGYFGAAERGTLFFDEIGNSDLELQASLLRVLEYGEITPVGTATPKPVNVQVIAATNADLEAMAERKEFRQDLTDRFTRTINVPPLRDRGDDVLLLANMFVQDFAKQFRGIDDAQFSQEAADLVRSYRWPGNVRELRNRVLNAVQIAPRGAAEWLVKAEHMEIEADPLPVIVSPKGPTLDESLPASLADVILDALLNGDEPVLDNLFDGQDSRYPGTMYFIEQLEQGLQRYLHTGAGKQLLRSMPNSAILSERFNLSARTDNRKKSFARYVRSRLDDVLDQCRKALK